MVCLDPQHRLLHEMVWEGLEDAAVDPVSLEGTNGGVFIGSWLNEYKDILSYSGHDEFYRMYMGNSIGAGAARISHLLGMTGPSIATESGCSSAMVAVHLACKSLERRETNFALACGVNLLSNPFDKEVMPMVVSTDGHCKTFDAKANGFARGEGCGVLVLKRLSDAVRNGDNIWGLIRGTGMTQEGVSKSMGTPTVHCESLAMRKALESGGVDPALVSYVEAHGTGTTVGDPMEIAAIAKAYHSKQRKEPLLIGSVKTNVGHTESCSGITGIMMVILAMQHEVIPSHRNFETLNPAIDLEAVPATIPLEPVQWPKNRQGSPRFAGVSCFGITGTDAHVILQETPTLLPNLLKINHLERPLHIMKISGKTEEALAILLESYKNKLSRCDNDLKDLAYTSNTGRADFSQRAIIIAKSKEDAVKSIEQNKFLRGEETPESLGKICFLFTGQGSQYPGMAKNLYETSPVFRMHFEYCEKILNDDYNIDITKVLWCKEKANEVSRTIYSQTSIFCVEYALVKLWESWGVKPDYALGHSLGEFAAAVSAGILTVEDALKLVAERSRLIDGLPRGKMLVIKANKERVDALMKKFAEKDQNMMLDYAALNSSDQTVVAGDSEVVTQFSEFCKHESLKCIVLDSTYAFHSKHMDPMLKEYGRVANTTQNLGGNDNCKFISGMRGTEIESTRINAQYWVEHTREKVLFMEASKKAVGLGCKTFIEIGPSPVLTALTMMNNDDGQLTCLASLRKNEDEWETLLTTLGKLYVKGLNIDWKGFEQFCERKKVRLPHYPFIGKKFWPDMLGVSGATIHPLVGSILPNASSSKIFENGLNLRSLDYIKDHSIGDHVIFPGAGYLEMCLAAGLATIEGRTDSLSRPSRPMKVENLSIAAPLLLQDGKTCRVQTVVDYNISRENEMDWNDLNIKICHRLERETNATKWLSHAKATFSPLPSAEDKNVSFDSSLLLQTLEKPSDDGILTQLYDKLASVGLKFGPTFRSIEKLWRDDDSQTLLAKVKVPCSEEQSNHYILHPIVLDAMIQALMMLRHTSSIKKKLYVPIKIGKFVWLSSGSGATDSSSPELYIHAFNSSSEANNPNDSALLLDSSGAALALMSSVEFIDTTVKAIQSVLDQQTSSLPEMWENVWRRVENLTESSLDLSNSVGSFYTEEFAREIETEFNIPSPHIQQTFEELDQLVYLNFLRVFQELGWEPLFHKEFKERDLISELKIEQQFQKYFGYMLQVLSSEGIVEKVIENEGLEGITWKVVKIFPNLNEILDTLSLPTFTSDLVSKFKSTLLYSEFGRILAGILRGTQSALGILFPEENKGYPTMADFYTEYGKLFRLHECLEITEHQSMSNVVQVMERQEKKILRILEVGAGTGFNTEITIKVLERLNVTDFEYTYTDISAAFFPAAQKRFEKYSKNMVYKKLDIEQDPIVQAFTPEYYDYIYMADVIHATRDIKESLRNIRMLMKPWAKLDMLEQTRVQRFLTSLFGVLEGFWRFRDLELRPNHCTLSRDSWEKVYKENGFGIDGTFSVLNNHHSHVSVHKIPDEIGGGNLPCKIEESKKKVWLLFPCESSPVSSFLQEKVGDVQGRKVLRVTEVNAGFEESGDSFKIRRDKEEDYSRIFKSIQSRGITVEGILYCWGLDERRVSQEEILQPYFYLTKAFLKLNLRVQPRVIALTRSTIPVVLDNELSHFHSSTLWAFTKSLKNEHEEINSRVVEVPDDNTPLNELKLQSIFAEIWNCDKEVQVAYHGTSRYVPRMTPHDPKNNDLELPKATDRFQLILPETKAISDLSFGVLELGVLGENQVEVQIKASALNFRDVLSVIKPTEQFKDINAVGFDFAGVVKKVGGKVTKLKPGDRVSGCNMENSALPSHAILDQDLLISLPENITLCEAAIIPAVYVTSVVCLIETAKVKKGDVVLLHTATGGVGLSAIEICKHVGCTIIATAGSKRKQNYLRSLGIQHIFHSRNTQYGDDILKATNGGGVDVVLNSLTSEGFKEATLKACAKDARFVEMSKLNIWKREQVAELRPDVDYTIVDVSSADASEWNRLMGVLRDLMDKKVVKPIPYVRFDGLNIREALQYMQKAKHIGKIVCVMPELRSQGGEIQVHTPMFNEATSYLITGGLGGIGFEVCKWMIGLGGKHVILAGRSPPDSSMQAKINELNSKGANVIPVQLDVGNFEQCRDLIQNGIGKLKLPPLRGIMHAAGIIKDAFIENQEWSSLSSTFGTKIDGTLNLHQLTKNLNLEHFITFSSSSALFGTAGQCNHAAANMFEDTFMHYRNSIGLPGMSVNWGQWGQVGIATEIDIPGLKTLSNEQGINGLEYAMKSQRTQLAIINFDSFVMFSKLVPYLSTYLDERVWKKNVKMGTVGIKSDKFWEQYDAQTNAGEKTSLLKEQIRAIIRSTLKLDENDALDDIGIFAEMGVDSLMFVEIKNSLQILMGDRVTISLSILKDCNNINMVTESLARMLEGDVDQLPEKPTPDQVNQLIREDSILPQHITSKPEQKACSVNEIRRVLLTGCTGTLGPYLLKQLTLTPQISQVVCIMRPSKLAPEKRLLKILEKNGLLPQINMDKIKCVTGNVALPQLGLEHDVWVELSESLDAIVHCAARIDHTEYYVKKESNHDTRAVNVRGTINIFEFACEGKLKHVCLEGSILSVAQVDEQGILLERWPQVEDYDGVTSFAYPISKFVGDVLARQAMERGIPTKLFRLPLITGDSQSGACSLENNHYLLRYLFILKNGIMPDNPFPMQLLPVYICADVSVRLFLDDGASPGVYNIAHLKPDIEQGFVNVASKLCFNIELVELTQLLQHVNSSDDENKKQDATMAQFEAFYDEEDLLSHYHGYRQWLDGGEHLWFSNKLHSLLAKFYEEQRPTLEYLYNDPIFAKSQGWF